MSDFVNGQEGNQQQNTASAGSSTGVNPEGVNPEGDNTDGDDEDNKPLYTQEQVDAMIAKRVKRLEKKYTKQNTQATPPAQVTGTNTTANQGGNGGNGQPDVNAIVAGVLQQLGVAPQSQQQSQQQSTGNASQVYQKVVNATAKAEALALGVKPEFVSDVMALAQLNKIEVDEDGEFDEVDVQKALKKVLKKHPSFGSKSSTVAPVKAGVKGQASPSTSKQPTERLAHLEALLFANKNN